jgi:glycosyltransferase involved in cell wall biosynthesis
MPVYNCALYLAEAIDSILNQSFTDFELIVLDDGSTDGSAEIAKSYSDSRIVYHCNEKNLGLANNLNVGLRMAKGKYIARMDGDDISLPERLQTQFDYLESHPDIDLCSCGLQMFGTENTVWVRESNPEAVKITMMFYSPVLHASSVWRREAFEKHNLYYDQNAFPAEDYDLWARAIFHCRLANIPQVLYKYRIHGIQVTKTDDRVAQKDREIRINFLRKALPDMNEDFYRGFVDKFISPNNFSASNIGELKGLYLQLLDANSKQHFFDHVLLQNRIAKYYQSYLLRMLQSKPDFSLQLKIMSEMSFRTFIKWLIK